jgi:DNA-binding response OmpR family regulator
MLSVFGTIELLGDEPSIPGQDSIGLGHAGDLPERFSVLHASRSRRGWHARDHSTAIVVLTASTLDEDRRAVAQSGADDFIAKPCREEELLEKIGTLLNVAYDYDDTTEVESRPVTGTTALSAALSQLPLELLEELRNATSIGNKRRLDSLILKVPETGDAGAARSLQELADKYQYDDLTRLLDEASVR